MRYSKGRQLIILGHSLGGTITTILTSKLDNVFIFLNIEGMLVEDDSDARSLTRASEFENPIEFVEYMCFRLKVAADSNIYMRRYLKNIQNTNPRIAHAWALSSTAILAGNKIDSLYQRLKCSKLYLQGEYTMSRLELNHLEKIKYDKVIIPESGHWPMLESPDRFWHIVGELITKKFELISDASSCC